MLIPIKPIYALICNANLNPKLTSKKRPFDAQPFATTRYPPPILVQDHRPLRGRNPRSSFPALANLLQHRRNLQSTWPGQPTRRLDLQAPPHHPAK